MGFAAAIPASGLGGDLGRLLRGSARDSFRHMITVETTAESTRLTIPKSDVPPDQLRPLLDWLRLEAAARRSQLTDAEADRLAEEMKTDWWTRNKAGFTEPVQP